MSVHPVERRSQSLSLACPYEGETTNVGWLKIGDGSVGATGVDGDVGDLRVRVDALVDVALKAASVVVVDRAGLRAECVKVTWVVVGDVCRKVA